MERKIGPIIKSYEEMFWGQSDGDCFGTKTKNISLEHRPSTTYFRAKTGVLKTRPQKSKVQWYRDEVAVMLNF